MPDSSTPSSPEVGDRDRPAGRLTGLKLISLLTLFSRILGLIRDIGMAQLFGAGAVLDAFTVAFRVPNLARRLFGEGALTAAFLPIFVRELEQQGRSSAWRLASGVLTVLACVLAALVVVGELALFCLHQFVDLTTETQLLVGLTAVLLPYLVLICLAAQVSAILNALNRFTEPAFLPVILNVFWIAAIWLVAPYLSSSHQQVYAISVCIVVAGVFQLAAPVPTLRRLGFRYASNWSAAKSQVAEIERILLPVLVGLSITQLNTVCDSLIAWSFARPDGTPTAARLWGTLDYPLESGTASALFLGQRLYQFPLGVFGVALGTILFPQLSRHAHRGEIVQLRDTLTYGLRLVIVVGLPASAGLLLLAEPLTALLFQHGAFDAQDTILTSEMVAAYGIGVWAYCGLLIVQRGYYAIGDRLTPVRVGVVVVVLNLALNLTLIWFLGGRALALSTAFCAACQLSVAIWLIQRPVGRFDWRRILKTTSRASMATVLMAVACRVAMHWLPPGVTLTSRVVSVLGPLLISVVCYLAAAQLLKLDEVWSLLRRSKK